MDDARHSEPPLLVKGENLSLVYGDTHALDGVDFHVQEGSIIGLIGPDGVGKSSLLALVSGARRLQDGTLNVLGGNMAAPAHRRRVCPRIAYMPQGLGKSLYMALAVEENLAFFGRLFGYDGEVLEARMVTLLSATGLLPFRKRPAGKLSGGMKQKLGLCCALIHEPDLLVLDEPTTGVDPLSRRQFWELIDTIRQSRPQMSVVVATAYMDEAAQFDRVWAMNAGRIMAEGSPAELLEQTGTRTMEAAFSRFLASQDDLAASELEIPPYEEASQPIAIQAENLSKRFGDFTAVDSVSFEIHQGEIFGFLGSNGCGKSTTMKVLTGLLEASEGKAELFGKPVEASTVESRMRVGYMSQHFSLYGELTVRQNLDLHAHLYRIPHDQVNARIDALLDQFGLREEADERPASLPLGVKQRLSLAVAMLHDPDLLILDEPTSGVDPIARDAFWRILIDLSRNKGVTIFISTHFMNEGARCDRISFMHAGRVLVSGKPADIATDLGGGSLEKASISLLEEASKETSTATSAEEIASQFAQAPDETKPQTSRFFSPRRMMSYARLEAQEIANDPIRSVMALVGSLILLFVMGFGISMDVDGLSYAVLDSDQTSLSSDYQTNLAGSAYFVEHPAILDYEDMDQRMRTGELAVAIEIPSGFSEKLERGRGAEIGVWIDGSQPMRAETVLGYVNAVHADWLQNLIRTRLGGAMETSAVNVETRFRYNPDVKSLVAMVPAVIPILLLMIPAILSSLSIVREKELGSITNFYVTPTRRSEFLMGKQMPYIVLGWLNFVILWLAAVTIFGLRFEGNFLAINIGALLYVTCSTGLGLLISTFLRSQIAAIIGTAILTLLPAVQFSGLTDPVSSLQGAGRVIGEIYPTSHFLSIARGTFSKALGFTDLQQEFITLIIMAPLITLISVLLLRKQET
ncbi:ribosome-associated ATPase/putative transporter RbbA [Henriciella aquimarina]|uniref:ribosome-associated ATPase/putative transporter RbbA n=1 Tax=Henriciella aquimarina TaxID=545261 RepID=UPI000A044E8B|nr:ribosome-associated ATPase/putative transporter RbbA [Henriciella aquimarina]